MFLSVSAGLEAIESLDLQLALKAGLFLDGCKIFLSGFNNTQIEKLRRCLNAGGATRFNQLTETVTHIVIGKVVTEHLNTIQSWVSKPHVVTGDWIVESAKLKKTADESDFLYARLGENEKVSPLVNKGNMSPPKMRRPSVNVPSEEDNNETFVDDALINQYMRKGTSDQSNRATRKSDVNEASLNESALPSSQAPENDGVFKGKTFTVSGYDDETIANLIDVITEHGGKIKSLDYSGHVNYSIVSLEGEGEFHPRVDYHVTHLFIEDCLEQEVKY